MPVIVTGATGLIGSHLVASLDKPVVLSRNADSARQQLGQHITAFNWDPLTENPPTEAFKSDDIVVHLAGEPVASGRWTTSKKKRIRDSRVIGTRNLCQTIVTCEHKLKLMISASAVGYYGSRGDEKLTEYASSGNDFLAEVCREWENETKPLIDHGIRVVNLRIGIVLDPNGGALSRMLPLFKMGLGGQLGSGKQWMPWIHIQDIIGLINFIIATDTISGPVNAVAPNPVTNREFTKVLAQSLHRPAIFPVPQFAVKLVFGELGSVLFASQRVVPEAALQNKYSFHFSDLKQALVDIVNRKS